MEEAKNLTNVLKDIAKKYGNNVVKTGVESLEVDGILSLGSPSFDFCLYGGIPEGRIIELSGAEGSGKTTTAFLIAASYQKVELARRPQTPRCIVYLDNEGTADPNWAKLLGYDMNDPKVKTILIRPEAQSAEEIFDMALQMLKTGEVGLLIFDSIATLVPQQIANESMEKQQMGGIAKALTRFANTALGLLRKYKATLIAINQVKDNMTGYGDALLTPGGHAWKHACSSRLMFKRGDFFDSEGNILAKKDAQSPAGHIIEVYVLKTKTCKWDRKLGYMHLDYTKGIDILQDTIDVAILLGFIDNSVQGSYTILNPDTGETMLDEKGNPIKIRGTKNVKPYFEEHKDLWKKLYDKVYEKLTQKEDPYIKSFEEMMNVNVYEKLGLVQPTNNSTSNASPVSNAAVSASPTNLQPVNNQTNQVNLEEI